MNKKTKNILICLSSLALLNSVFVPIFDLYGGFFPKEVEEGFSEVIKKVTSDSGAWRYWSVSLTMSIFLPSLLMFCLSWTGNVKLFALSNALAIIIWIKNFIFDFGIKADRMDELFGAEYGCISFGSWTAIIIYVISILIVIQLEKRPPKEEPYHADSATKGVINIRPILLDPIKCPRCGMLQASNRSCCFECGYLLNAEESITDDKWIEES